jgi:hypothetical protein
MGWKAFNLIAVRGDADYLTSFPAPDPAKARDFIRRIGGAYESHGDSTLEQALYPQDHDDLYVGAYANALVIGSVPITQEAFKGGVPRAVQCATAMLPGCRALIAMLHSVVDLFGYAWYENGKLRRARAGSGDDGIFFEKGSPLPIEEKLKANDEAIDGEEMVMELCRPFLGCRIDQYDAWDLKMELFKRKRGWTSWWRGG